MAQAGDSPVGTAHEAGMQKRARESPAYKAALEDQEPYEQLARLMIHKRMQLGLTQQELADRMGTCTPELVPIPGVHRKRPAGEAGRFWGYYREERYVSLYMWIRGR